MMAPEIDGSLAAKAAKAASSPPQATENIEVLRDDETLATSSIPIIVAPPCALPNPMKRDSGLAPTSSATDLKSCSTTTNNSPSALTCTNSPRASATSLLNTPCEADNPDDVDKEGQIGVSNSKKTSKPASLRLDKHVGSDDDFSPLTTPIPTQGQLELKFMDQLSFSQRGSVLLEGKKAFDANGKGDAHSSERIGQPISYDATPATRNPLSDELESESEKVRSMYEPNADMIWEHGMPTKSDETDSITMKGMGLDPGLTNLNRSHSCSSILPDSTLRERRESISSTKRAYELAGGIEDWEDVNEGDVDRYGFITISRERSLRPGTPEPRRPQRVSTVLQLASNTPRRRRGFGRTLSSAKSARSAPHRALSRKMSATSLNTQATSLSSRNPSRQAMRTARNLLPGSQDRRWMAEAGDMLTLPPGLADIAEDVDGGRAAELIKRKEWGRTEKWRKMAKVLKGGLESEGMIFEFDTQNPKLVERTWKGIPDRWRAAAWHSFLSTSAKKYKDSPTDAQIVRSFHQYLKQNSTDDVQIDMDVPRTINSHIMFRRRYRGGQRLLFRVLHSLSLYFPSTGYVQGMASLAATLLCYYDEEKTFIMLVRMWQLRGLEKLYAPGFAGLMAALDEFQKQWMNGHDVSMKLDELGIDTTAYGTRWYLTLFNYSIPFPAQLRVWDVFMLLGDSNDIIPSSDERPFQGGLDVLHAASAALIDGMREILLDSDFENSMKALTSWVPVKDEELFMKVAKAEWKLHHRRGRPSR